MKKESHLAKGEGGCWRNVQVITRISISEQGLSVFPYHVESSGQIFIINSAISASPVKHPLMLLWSHLQSNLESALSHIMVVMIASSKCCGWKPTMAVPCFPAFWLWRERVCRSCSLPQTHHHLFKRNHSWDHYSGQVMEGVWRNTQH